MKNISRCIPGFRTGKLWKMVIALVYYSISLMFLAREGLSAFIMLASIPFVIFAITSITMEEKKKHFLITLICAILIFSIGVQLGNFELRKATIENQKTPITQGVNYIPK